MEGISSSRMLGIRSLRVLWRLLLPLGVGLFVVVTARLSNATPDLQEQARAVSYFLLGFGVLWALLYELLSPFRAKLRLVPLSDLRARRVTALGKWILLLLLGGELAIYLLETNGAHPSLPALLRLVRDAGLILVAWLVVRRTGVLERWVPEKAESAWALLLKWVIRFVVPLGVFTALAYVTLRALGYVVLAEWTIGRAELTAVIVLGVVLVHRWSRRSTSRMVAFMRGVEAEEHDEGDGAADGEGEGWIAVDRLVRLLLGIAAVALAALVVMRVWGITTDEVGGVLARNLPRGSERTWMDLLDGVLQVCLVLLAGRILHDFLVFGVFPRRSTEFGVRYATVKLLKYVVILIAVLVGATALGFDASTVAVFAGGAGVGLSFALKDILSNFFSGLILLFGEAVRVGDVVEVGGVIGTVEAIRLRGTVIRARDGNAVILPNQQMIGEQLINKTQGLKVARLEVPVGVSYGSDLEQVESVLLREARATDGVLEDPGAFVRLAGFGDSSVDMQLFCSTDQTGYGDRFRIQYELRKAVFAAFRREGIEIPFPQRDLHVRTEGPPSEQ